MRQKNKVGNKNFDYSHYTCINSTSMEVPHIILVHGLGMDRRYWYKIIPLLRESFSVITYDLRGHGKSELGDKKISWELLTDDLKNLVDELKINSFHIVGHGLGANLAMYFSYRFPKSIKSLTVISTLIYFPVEVTNQILSYRKKLSQLGSLQPLAEYLIPKIMMDTNTHDRELLKSCYSNVTVDTYFQYWEKLIPSTLTLEQVSQLMVPTLLLSGEYDPIFPPKAVGIATYTIPNNHYIIIPNASNGTFLDQPMKTTECMTKFIFKDLDKTTNTDRITSQYINELSTHLTQLVQVGATEIKSNVIEVKLMDNFSVEINDTPITKGWNQRMAKKLFCYLLLHQTVVREQICDDLMPEKDLVTAKRDLRVYLNHLKKLINRENMEFLQSDKEHIYLRGRITCDLVDYMNQIKDLEEKDICSDYLQFKRVLINAPKDILPGIYDEWALTLKNNLQKQVIKLAENLSSYHLDV